MVGAAELRRAAERAFAHLRQKPGVPEVEVFVSANTSLFVRLNYTSHIPCNGVEEPKSVYAYGIGVRAAFDTAAGVLAGFGSEPGRLDLEGAERELAQRVIHFLSGTVYALSGETHRISSGTLFFAPGGVEVVFEGARPPENQGG